MDPAAILRWEGTSFLHLLGALIVVKMLTRKIRMDGLFSSKRGPKGVTAERVQLLVTTLAIGAKYLSDAAYSSNGAMPNVSSGLLYLAGGSSGIYASVKAIKTWSTRH